MGTFEVTRFVTTVETCIVEADCAEQAEGIVSGGGGDIRRESTVTEMDIMPVLTQELTA